MGLGAVVFYWYYLTGIIRTYIIININQNTIITVYEVEHQNTVITKLGKQTIWFSEVIKDICHYFQKKIGSKTKKDRG